MFAKLKSRLMHRNLPDIGLLILRISAGGYMLLGHGVGKVANFTQIAPKFPDPLGIGSQLSLALAAGAEFFCAIAIIVGFYTRLATIPLIITMLVAAIIVHAGDPFAKRELALLYLSCFTALFFLGSGAYSADEKLK